MSVCSSRSSDDSQPILDGHFDFVLDELIQVASGHACHLCRQTFLTGHDFKAHLRLHGQQAQFHCPECDQVCFGSSTKLWSHMSRVHFKTRRGFECSLCETKSFKMAFNYHLHMLIHLEEQPEACRFCSKAFRTKPSLRKHELIHTGTRDEKQTSSVSN